MKWANILYIYQPPTQKDELFDKVVKQSYVPILDLLLANPQAKLTLQVNGGMVERFAQTGKWEVIDKIKSLLERNQLELTETSAYQAFLPMLPKDEVRRQILINRSIFKKYFGDAYKISGFFPTAMAFSQETFDIIKELGYRWVILDETALDQKIPNKEILEYEGILIFIRNREFSFQILTSQIENHSILIDKIRRRYKNDEYLITAMDGETFGHHRLGYEEILFYIYNSDKFSSVLMSDLEYLYTERKQTHPKESTWVLPMASDKNPNTFERWYNSKNNINKLQKKLLTLAINTVNKSMYKIQDPMLGAEIPETLTEREKVWIKARYLLDSAMHQEQFFFTSAKPNWDLELIEKGAFDLYESIRLVPDVTEKVRNEAHKLYTDIVLTGIKWQRTQKIDAIVKNFFQEEKGDEEEEVILPASKYKEGIKRLQREMEIASKGQDYDIAQKLKERIEEMHQKQEHFRSK